MSSGPLAVLAKCLVRHVQVRRPTQHIGAITMPLRLALRRAGISNLAQSARQKSLADVAASSSRRHGSSSAPRRFFSTTLLVGGGIAFVAYYYDSRSLMHEHVVMPIVRLFDPETGHKLAIKMLSLPSWARPRDRGVDGAELQAEVSSVGCCDDVSSGKMC